MTTTPSRFLQRYDISTNWSTISSTLYAGEFGYSYDNSTLKIGNGTNSWSNLNAIDIIPSKLQLVNGIFTPPSSVGSGSIFAYYYGIEKWIFSANFVSIDPVTFAINYTIDNFDDVDISTTPLTDGDILTWNTLNSKWFNVSTSITGIESTTAPSSSTDIGTTGEIRYDSSYIYICVTTNTWKRFVLATW